MRPGQCFPLAEVMGIIFVSLEDIGETHFGGFMKKKRSLQEEEEEV